jgi:hypothetical protein
MKLVENPALNTSFFYEKIKIFMKALSSFRSESKSVADFLVRICHLVHHTGTPAPVSHFNSLKATRSVRETSPTYLRCI